MVGSHQGTNSAFTFKWNACTSMKVSCIFILFPKKGTRHGLGDDTLGSSEHVCVCSEINSWHFYILDTKVRLCLQLLSSKWHSDAPGPECPVADLWWLAAQTRRTKTAALCEVWPGDRQTSRERHSSTRLQMSSTSQRYEWNLTCGYTGCSFNSALSCNGIDCLVLQFSTEPPTDTGYLRYSW